MYANSEYTVCMYVCMCVSAVVTSMEVQLRYIEPFDIGEWQRMYRPELLDYSGILQIHPVAERITSSPNRHGHGHGAGEKDDCVSVSAQPRIVLLTSGNLTDNGSERMLHGNTYIQYLISEPCHSI